MKIEMSSPSRGRSADAATPESWVIVQSVRAVAAMEKTRVRAGVRVKCMVKLRF